MLFRIKIYMVDTKHLRSIFIRIKEDYYFHYIQIQKNFLRLSNFFFGTVIRSGVISITNNYKNVCRKDLKIRIDIFYF